MTIFNVGDRKVDVPSRMKLIHREPVRFTKRVDTVKNSRIPGIHDNRTNRAFLGVGMHCEMRYDFNSVLA